MFQCTLLMVMLHQHAPAVMGGILLLRAQTNTIVDGLMPSDGAQYYVRASLNYLVLFTSAMLPAPQRATVCCYWNECGLEWKHSLVCGESKGGSRAASASFSSTCCRFFICFASSVLMALQAFVNQTSYLQPNWLKLIRCQGLTLLNQAFFSMLWGDPET